MPRLLLSLALGLLAGTLASAQSPGYIDPRVVLQAVIGPRPADRTANLVGVPLPPAVLQTLAGTPFDTRTLRGKPTLVNTWFTFCQPCIAEMPALNSLKIQFGEQVNFVAITFDSAEEVAALLADTPFDFTHVVGAQDYLNFIGAKAFPRSLFLDRDGVVRQVEYGVAADYDADGTPEPGDGGDFAEILQGLLRE